MCMYAFVYVYTHAKFIIVYYDMPYGCELSYRAADEFLNLFSKKKALAKDIQ